MFIEFKCENFLSFKDEAVLNMTTVDTYEEHNDSNVIKSTNREGLQLLKSVAIFGSNGGGKSNFMKALTFMKLSVARSFRDSLEPEAERPIWNHFYRLSTQTVNQPSKFEVSVVLNGVIYRYGFSILNWDIIGEWLFKTDKRETRLFERNGMDFNFNNSSFPEGAEHKNVNRNVLLLSYLAQHNALESSIVYSWFRTLNIMDGLDNNYVQGYTKSLLERNTNFKEWANVALRFLEISGIEIEDGELVAVHNKFDENNFVSDQVRFKVDSEESHGTSKLVYLLGGLYDTLTNGKTFAIDEFDSKLHPNLTRKLVELFHKYNSNGAQLIVTVHDPTLLDNDIYRRDQIWFMDKNQFGASELYPMSNFKATDGLRKTSDFRKLYLNCHFGAAEAIRINDDLINLLQHE
ncbi:ATP/GTP-binding protein [Reichenbachiella sp. MSK19-1]|uniref:AAA family ATPase n=1 Tax=Reichenbachiella sp. MSK19-1 TaxID=1897631 RepID=UPI000E6CE464|nr:ATP-binding protein [Reichenbachiella sp. MSK19-1]RJE72758.1 AAA family ATPase [Reichenbachiella sp. MSK19-1]